MKMSVQQVNIQDILVDGSRFSPDAYFFASGSTRSLLEASFQSSGILYPAVLFRDSKGALHLIDGRKRIAFARQHRIQRIDAAILTEHTPVTDIILLILCNLRDQIESSVINKVQFLCFAESLKAPGPWLVHTLSVALGFHADTAFLGMAKRIFNIPEEIRMFCHEKKFSFKQLISLTGHDDNILEHIGQWQPTLHLTASTLDEIAENLRDYLRGTERNIETFINDPDVREIFDAPTSPREKTEKLRRLLYMKRFPTLSVVNDTIRDTIDKLNLPGEIDMKWDHTLENKNADLTIHLNDPKKWDRLLDIINSGEIRQALRSILNEL